MDLFDRLTAANARLKEGWFSIQHKGGGRGNSYLIKWTRDQSWVGTKHEEFGPFAGGQECVECAERLVDINLK